VATDPIRYADRAKAIPVNAVKNDESEQVEKLNNEIAALRKKLEEQVCVFAGIACAAPGSFARAACEHCVVFGTSGADWRHSYVCFRQQAAGRGIAPAEAALIEER
jgi:hypothetical protein